MTPTPAPFAVSCLVGRGEECHLSAVKAAPNLSCRVAGIPEDAVQAKRAVAAIGPVDGELRVEGARRPVERGVAADGDVVGEADGCEVDVGGRVALADGVAAAAQAATCSAGH